MSRPLFPDLIPEQPEREIEEGDVMNAKMIPH